MEINSNLTFLGPAEMESFPVPTALQCLVHDMLVSVVVAYDWEFLARFPIPLRVCWSMFGQTSELVES